MRIMILGPSGSGKSTLCRRLGDELGLEVIHLDKYFWRPGWKIAEKEEFLSLIKNTINKDNWAMDGNYGNWLYEQRCRAADVIIFINYNRFKAIWRILKRRIMYHNKTRDDLPDDCPEKIDFEFFRYVCFTYPKKQKQYIQYLTANFKNKLIIIQNQKQYLNFKL